MRTNEEFTKAVYERRDDFLVKRKKKRRKIATAVSPLIICVVLFSAFLLPDWGGFSVNSGEKTALRSSPAPEELFEKQMADGLISSVQNGQSSGDAMWEDFYFTEDDLDMYDAISVRVVNDFATIRDGEDTASEHMEYAIWLTRGKETMAFTMEGDDLYYNGEYCRKLDESEIEYLLDLAN